MPNNFVSALAIKHRAGREDVPPVGADIDAGPHF